jgi:hypothetical protein
MDEAILAVTVFGKTKRIRFTVCNLGKHSSTVLHAISIARVNRQELSGGKAEGKAMLLKPSPPKQKTFSPNSNPCPERARMEISLKFHKRPMPGPTDPIYFRQCIRFEFC